MKPYSNDLRTRVIEAYENKEGSMRQLAKRFLVSLFFVWTLIKRYRETGKVDPKPHGGGNPSKIDEAGIEVLRSLVEEDSDATVEELQKCFEEKTQIKVSTSAVGRALLKYKLTRKKKTLRATEQDTDKVKKHHKEYFEEIEKIDPEDLVFLDETGSNIAMHRKYARSPKGERAYDSRPAKRGGNVTIIGALSLSGIVAAMSIDGAADGDVFTAYITEVLVPQLREGNVVVMDNVSTHKVAGIREAIESVNARVLNLPEYSPELNPIEECWSKVKSVLRTIGARTRELIDQAITEALETITEKDALGWFTHAGYCIAPK